MTIQSFTDPNKTYEVTFDECDCPNFIHYQAKVGGICKHIKAYRQSIIIQAANRDTIFEMLRLKFDCRSQAVIEAKRAAYWNFEMALAS